MPTPKRATKNVTPMLYRIIRHTDSLLEFIVLWMSPLAHLF